MKILTLNDRYIRGRVAFDDFGETARMSYMGLPKLPINSQYEIDGKKWRVVAVTGSSYTSNIVNVDLELIYG